MKLIVVWLLCILGPLFGSQAWAVTSVNPNGVNVRSTGPTTVFLTFHGTADQRAVDAFWCGDINAPANTPTLVNPCVPGTLFGHLPSRSNLSRASGGAGGVSNTTDIMTIPASVARRAYQAALRGEASQFFYVRQFVDANGLTQFIAVTCRMAGGGARVPLALTGVEMFFETDDKRRAVQLINKGVAAPPIGAKIYYNGSGRLKGRWEVVKPGELDPAFEDLLTEASLPVELRGTQRRYTLLDRFDLFLQPTGEVFLPGPDPSLIPTQSEGAYKILLRIEATAEKEGNSDTLGGIVISGGVAGFPLPVLRYFVGSESSTSDTERSASPGTLSLLFPKNDYVVHAGQRMNFSWVPLAGAAYCELEIRNSENTVFTAIVQAEYSDYTLPPWVEMKPGELARWRVAAMDSEGKLLGKSGWRRIVGN